MIKKPFNKTSTGKTGKDILNLISSNRDKSSVTNILKPETETETKLYEIWVELLGHQTFGITDDFFSIGGSSIKGIQMLSRIHKLFMVEISLTDMFLNSTIKKLAKVIDEGRPSEEVNALESYFPKPDQIPLSFGQERIYFIDKLEGSFQYHIPAVIQIEGDLNLDALNDAFDKIILRHEVLRTIIQEQDGIMFQKILEHKKFSIPIQDCLKIYGNASENGKLKDSMIYKSFDLSKDLMIRVNLLKYDSQNYELIIVLHHIAADGWSMPILVNEVIELYHAFCENRTAALPKLSVQFSDYAIWQRKGFDSNRIAKKLEYWKQKLDGLLPLELPSDHPRPAVRGTNGTTKRFEIENDLLAKIQSIERHEGTSMYMCLLAAFNVLLYKYSGQDDISVGASVANRPKMELENLIGFFVNTLAFRNKIDSNSKFSELLEQVKITTLEAYENQDVPFEKVVEATVKERDSSRSPLFQVMFVFIDTPEQAVFEMNDVELRPKEYVTNISKFDLTFHIRRSEHGLNIAIEYSTDLFKEASIERMFGHYKTILNTIAENPFQSIAKIDMLAPKELASLTGKFSESNHKYPADSTILDLFLSHVDQTPNAEALRFEDTLFTYSELNHKANLLANSILQQNIKPNSLLPLFVERGAEMIIGVLGILKSGCAYVPIDRELPEDRVNYILEDIGSKLVITDKKSESILNVRKENTVLCIEDTLSAASDEPKTKIEQSQIAYVIYTSGSTGQPKGVLVSHKNILDYLYGIDDRLGISKCKSFAFLSSISTDLGNTSLFGSWLSGAVLHVFSKESVSDAYKMNAYFKKHQIDCLKIVPSHWQALIEDNHVLIPDKLLIFGGEALHGNLLDKLPISSKVQVINHYGPTETTIGKLLYKIDKTAIYNGTVPIGKVFGNNTVYILNKDKGLCPVGVSGELFISGDGLSNGYLNKPELNTERFISNPFGEGKIYATGDLAKYLEDGNIEYVGRIDNQIKIRGYRVELGDIESVIQQSLLVESAVVIAKSAPNGINSLIAYIQPDSSYSKESLMQFLKYKLPDYMLPQKYIEVDKFPLLTNGKIDRKSLPEIETDFKDIKLSKPTNKTEETMVKIWQQILEMDEVGVHDDFFELGGHSLLAIRLVSAIRKAFKVEMPIGDIFDYPTIAELSTRIIAPKHSHILPPIEKIEPKPAQIPLSFAQERLWFIDQLEGSIQYHTPSVLKLKGKLNIEALENAFRYVISRHEVLKYVIHEDAGKGYQTPKKDSNWNIEIVRDLPSDISPEALQIYLRKLIDKPFDLSRDYMIRAHLVCLSENEFILLVTQHHIATDRWSTAILVKEFVEIYNSQLNNHIPNLKPLKISYADYALWQRKYLSEEVLSQKINYWKNKLQGFTQLEMPLDYARTNVWSSKGALLTFQIQPKLHKQLLEFSQKHGATLFMTMLSAFKALLHRYTSQDDISVGTSIVNRKNSDTEDLIGFFVNTISLRTLVPGSISFRDLLNSVKLTTLEAYEHLDAPYEKVVDALVSERDMSRNALFQILFVMHNTQEIPDIKLQDVELSVLPLNHDVSRFDFSISLAETHEGISGQMQYCTDLFKESTMKRLIGCYLVILQACIDSPEQTINRLPMLNGESKREILYNSQPENPINSNFKNIVEWFESQVEISPNANALSFEGQTLSYKELNERSNKIANALVKKGVKINSPVPMILERGAEMIICMLGILKAGAAYVPIDPEFPKDRIDFILKDTSSSLILCSKSLRSLLPDIQNFEVIEPDIFQNGIIDNPKLRIAPESMAYIIYTSGSTGQPKGVIVEHRNLVDYTAGLDNAIILKNSKSFALVSTIATDLGNTVIFGSLLSGGNLHVFSSEKVSNIEWLHEYFKFNSIDCLKIVPSHWKALSIDHEQLIPNQHLIFGGEALDNSVLEKLNGKINNCQVFNHYGPTETTIGKLIYKVDLSASYPKTVPIGKPFSNTSVYILNSDLELCPIGVPGQLFIGGAGVARGYLQNDLLTNEKFIGNPFNSAEHKILYATGDLVKSLNDGNIEFIGRVDNQVKIRGYRVELGEIETAFKQSKLVKEVAVIAKNDENGNLRLIAYILPEGQFDKDALVFSIKDRLPDYMLPAVYVELKSIPLTANGKLDRNALPDPKLPENNTDERIAPESEVELKLAEIWKTLLKVEKVGIHDNFFDFGGDSIITLQFVSRVRRAGYELQPKDVFIYQTISGLASLIEQKLLKAKSTVKLNEPSKGIIGLLPVQQWYFEKTSEDVSYYNQSALLNINKLVSEENIKSVLGKLLKHHDVFRLTFRKTGENWSQEFIDKEAEFYVEDLSRNDTLEISDLIETLSNKYQASLNIEAGVSYKFVLVKTNDYQLNNRLLIVIHHLLMDAVSWGVLLDDLALLLDKSVNNQALELGAKGSSYAEWHKALVNFSQTQELKAQIGYWSKIIQKASALPLDFNLEVKSLMKNRKTISAQLDSNYTSKLILESSKAYQTEIQDLLIYALTLTITSWNHTDSLLFAMEGHGREQLQEDIDLSRTIGWFTTIYPVCIALESNESLGNQLRSVKEQLRNIPQHGLGFGLLKYINKHAELNKPAAFDILFNYLGQIGDKEKKSSLLSKAAETAGLNVSENQNFSNKLVFNSSIHNGSLEINLSYSDLQFNKETINKLLHSYIENLTTIIKHCVEIKQSGKKALTPSDFGQSSNVTLKQLDEFLKGEDDIDDVMSF
jgi:amino acid adenylation domain-containing protein/non-ribosomal peptide synthase protein (TIGR01720 family)